MAKPVRYRAQYMEPGVISYEDIGDGKVFVSRDALDRMRRSFVGCPVVNAVHQDLSAEEAFGQRDNDPESWADGIVVDVGHDAQTGWDYADMIIWDEDTQRNIDRNGFSVSCAYIPTTVGSGGVWHGIEYDEEIVNGEYTHMAIVDSPRYEGATIYLNSKGERKEMRFKLFSSKQDDGGTAPVAKQNSAAEADEQTLNMDEAYVETEDGEKIPVAELISAYKERANTSDEPAMLNADDEVDVGEGEMVKVSELLSAYQNVNAEPPQDDAAEPAVDEAKQRENATKVRKAVANADPEGEAPNISTREDRVAQGQLRYGKKVAQQEVK